MGVFIKYLSESQTFDGLLTVIIPHQLIIEFGVEFLPSVVSPQKIWSVGKYSSVINGEMKNYDDANGYQN